MIARLAFRSLTNRPLRTLLLALGFGLGIAVMAILLGVGEVILAEARSPALQGGGDLVVTGAAGPLENARFVLTRVVRGGEMDREVVAASPWKRATVYLVSPKRVWAVTARAGIPSLERALGDQEIAGQRSWVDAPADPAWAMPATGDVLRAMDRFHTIPKLPEFADSWAEWLYFNGHTADGRTRFYLTFMFGPSNPSGGRSAAVRLQLDENGATTNYSTARDVDEATLLERAPDVEVAGNTVHLEGSTYRIALRLPREGGSGVMVANLTLDGAAGQSLPPLVMRGARGWLSGYTVPVLSGPIRGTLGDRTVEMSGYHDHNWGFWRGVRWQWGQVAGGDLSFVYGRVFPPASVADPSRVPGFLGVLGPEGVVGTASDVSITEGGDNGDRGRGPRTVTVAAKGSGVNLRLAFVADETIRTALRAAGPADQASADFLQLNGVYHVSGEAGGRHLDFTSRGAAETFR